MYTPNISEHGNGIDGHADMRFLLQLKTIP